MMDVLPLTDDIIIRAATLYGQLRQTGKLIGDADILIAATCLEHDHDLVTNNNAHFSRIPGLTLQNWLGN